MSSYERKMRAMERMEGGRTSEDFTEDVDFISPEEERGDFASMGITPAVPQTQAAPQAPAGGTGATTAGSGLTTAGMATANPYLTAAGLGLQVIGGAQQRKQQREQSNINAEMARRERVMALMGRLGSGYGRIG